MEAVRGTAFFLLFFRDLLLANWTTLPKQLQKQEAVETWPLPKTQQTVSGVTLLARLGQIELERQFEFNGTARSLPLPVL